MRENWGHKGMPPIYVDVLHREVVHESDTFRSEVVYIRGDHKHLGKYNAGWTGHETVVRREIIKSPSSVDMDPNIEYPIIRIKK